MVQVLLIYGIQTQEDCKKMTFDEFLKKVLAEYPDAIVRQDDNSGEIVIETGMKLDKENNVCQLD